MDKFIPVPWIHCPSFFAGVFSLQPGPVSALALLGRSAVLKRFRVLRRFRVACRFDHDRNGHFLQHVGWIFWTDLESFCGYFEEISNAILPFGIAWKPSKLSVFAGRLFLKQNAHLGLWDLWCVGWPRCLRVETGLFLMIRLSFWQVRECCAPHHTTSIFFFAGFERSQDDSELWGVFGVLF